MHDPFEVQWDLDVLDEFRVALWQLWTWLKDGGLGKLEAAPMIDLDPFADPPEPPSRKQILADLPCHQEVLDAVRHIEALYGKRVGNLIHADFDAIYQELRQFQVLRYATIERHMEGCLKGISRIRTRFHYIQPPHIG